MASWRIGSKVVCVKDGWYPVTCATDFPKKDVVYTLRGTSDKAIPCGGTSLIEVLIAGTSLPGLLLREISNAPCQCWGSPERPFDETAFRPVIDDESKSKETVEQLKKLTDVTKTPEKVQ